MPLFPLFLCLALISIFPAAQCKGKPVQSQTQSPRENALALLRSMSASYRSQGVRMAFERTTYAAQLDRKKLASGQLYLDKGALRMEVTSPDPSLLVFDQKVLWVEEQPPKEFGGSVQVAKMPVLDNSKEKTLLRFFMGDEKTLKGLDLVKQSAEGQLKKSVWRPRPGGVFSHLSEIEIWFDEKGRVINKLAYQDELGNRTSYEFKDISTKARLDQKLFTYKPPEGAVVTDYGAKK